MVKKINIRFYVSRFGARGLALLLCMVASVALLAEGVQKPASWSVSARRVSAGEAELLFSGAIKKSWIVYSVSVPEDGPMPIAVTLAKGDRYRTAGKLVELSTPKEKHDEMFDMKVKYFTGEVKLSQRVALSEAAPVTISGVIEYQCCNDMECVLLEDDFSVQVAAAQAPTPTPEPADGGQAAEPAFEPAFEQQPEHSPELAAIPAQTSGGNGGEQQSLLTFFLLALLAGFAGVLTPCVFPMLPMTISFFMRGNSRSKGVRKAAVFGSSIILIYVAIGAIVTVTKTADMANIISTHWLVNLLFFALFILFAASFLGAVDISLPSKLSNSIDRQADKGGYFSTFFVALALTVISFSCTGPFVGALLVSAATGAALKPIIGMLGFGLAFALPFTLLALFPSALKKLPKSGGWMNAIKVAFAFILALFSLKFLSIADQALGFDLISRELFICIWVTLLALLGLYFLGKLRFAHDDEAPHVSVPRFALAVASLCLALYLFTGLLGNPLSSFSGFFPAQRVAAALPPAGEATPAAAVGSAEMMLCGVAPKYSNLNLHGPANLPAFFDVEEALACAREQGKQVLVDFKGHFCTNCKKMEGEVFANGEVQTLLKEKFVIAALYTDDKTPLAESEWYTSTFDGKVKKTIGQKNRDYQVTAYKVNSQPYFVILNGSGVPQGKPVGYISNPKQFMAFLEGK
ncbi:MAG: thioredoxin fold domain-containing protein [Prevotellaceae bacterium]|jgi:thiol:disulfide interchange protein DsbD|nr:thioredoxin fold domain-containing protein [Prevotellaceae bacterium]